MGQQGMPKGSWQSLQKGSLGQQQCLQQGRLQQQGSLQQRLGQPVCSQQTGRRQQANKGQWGMQKGSRQSLQKSSLRQQQCLQQGMQQQGMQQGSRRQQQGSRRQQKVHCPLSPPRPAKLAATSGYVCRALQALQAPQNIDQAVQQLLTEAHVGSEVALTSLNDIAGWIVHQPWHMLEARLLDDTRSFPGINVGDNPRTNLMWMLTGATPDGELPPYHFFVNWACLNEHIWASAQEAVDVIAVAFQ